MPLETGNHILMPQEAAWATFRREFTDFLGRDAPKSGSPDAPALGALTPREREILNTVARGLDSRAIAALLRNSDKTVRNHLTAVFSKLGTADRAQAIVVARNAGLGRD